MYVGAYVVVIGYFLLAAISTRATVIPNTWLEFARVGVLVLVALAMYYWGALTNRTLIVLRPKNHSDEGFPRADRDVA